jgi:hypothetical protein
MNLKNCRLAYVMWILLKNLIKDWRTKNWSWWLISIGCLAVIVLWDFFVQNVRVERIQRMDKELTLEVTEIADDHPNTRIIAGGDPGNPLWDEYYQDTIDEYKPHMSLIKEWVLEQDKIPTGEDLNGEYFVFSDGLAIGFTWRGWGDLAQAIANKKEGYMKYYMTWSGN